jgi:hypothetical protein
VAREFGNWFDQIEIGPHRTYTQGANACGRRAKIVLQNRPVPSLLYHDASGYLVRPQIPMNFRLFLAESRACALLCSYCALFWACTNAPRKEVVDRQEYRPPELLEPSEKSSTQQNRCQTKAGSQTLSLRAEAEGGGAKGEPEPAELGNAVEFAGGFVVGVLRGTSESRAEIDWFDARGRERRLDLGVVHGSVEPPWLFPVAHELIVVVPDNDAGHSTLRLAKVSEVAGDFTLTWGPTIQRRRSERAEFSVATDMSSAGKEGGQRVTLAWDAPDNSTLKSAVHALSFSLASMKTVAMERVISPTGNDAVSPMLLARGGGFWFIWAVYGDLKGSERPGSADDGSLIDEAPRRLYVQPLDGDLRGQGAPLLVSDDEADVLAFDGALVGDDALFLAFRAASPGQILGTRAIGTRVVSIDGTQQRGLVENESLGPGAPLLLPGEKTSPWLVSRGEEDEVLLGLVESGGQVAAFSEEPNLEGHIPLLRRGDELLTMHSRGLDLEVSLYDCRLSTNVKPTSGLFDGQNP